MDFVKIPCIYFPTSVIMIDDNMSFLENIRMTINDYSTVSLFSDPEKAFYSLNLNSALENINVLGKIDEDEIDIDNAFSIDYTKLSSYFNVNNDTSVVVIDYSMPEMNGVDFCKKIKSMKAKKIMLTGEADTEVAVDAFNRGLISKFIIKNSSNIQEILNQSINELKIQYFLDSRINELVSSFAKIKENEFYIKLASAWIKLNNIVRYYQTDNFGSLAGLDEKNQTSYLHILSEEKFQEYQEIAKQQGGADNLISQLLGRKKIPVFLSPKSKELDINQWDLILHKIQGFFQSDKQTYYYCSGFSYSYEAEH